MIIREFQSDDGKLTCRVYKDNENKYFLSSIDLLGQEIASKRIGWWRQGYGYREAWCSAMSYVDGAMMTYDAMFHHGMLDNSLDWGDDLR